MMRPARAHEGHRPGAPPVRLPAPACAAPARRLAVNHKRLFRLYREERLTVRRRGGRKRAIGTRAPMLMPLRPNERWSLDFVSDQMTDGRRFRILAIVDDCTRECLALVADTSLSGCAGRARARQADRQPRQAEDDRQRQWQRADLQRHPGLGRQARIEWHYIAPGKPMQNGFIESFNGRLRDELLNETLFSAWPRPEPRSGGGDSTTTPHGRTRSSDGRRRSTSRPHSTRAGSDAALVNGSAPAPAAQPAQKGQTNRRNELKTG